MLGASNFSRCLRDYTDPGPAGGILPPGPQSHSVAIPEHEKQSRRCADLPRGSFRHGLQRCTIALRAALMDQREPDVRLQRYRALERSRRRRRSLLRLHADGRRPGAIFLPREGLLQVQLGCQVE